METAISLPDALFRDAEKYAARSGKTRSKLYADALSEYLARHAAVEVTETMNRVMERVRGPYPDPALRAVARRVFENTEW